MALTGCTVLTLSAPLAIGAGAAGSGASNTLTVTAGEYTYVVKGKPKGGWTRIDFRNAGVENHMMVVVSLKKGTTQAQFESAMAAEDESAFAAIAGKPGDPTMPGTPALIGPRQRTSTLTNLPAGTYGLACFVPAPDGKTHAEHGMMKVFDVSGKSNLKPPTSGVAKVTLDDTSITVPPGDAPRRLTAQVTNDGTTPHSFQLVKLVGDRPVDEVKTYFDTLFSTGTAPAGEAPGVFVGGVQSVAPDGGVAYVSWVLPAGSYAYVSTDGDQPDDDYSKGLKGTFTIG